MRQSVVDDSSFSLSYLGDAWYELWCRHYILRQCSSARNVHPRVVAMVRCQTQAEIMRLILPLLTLDEEIVFKRGKNVKPQTCPRHASVKDYRFATGFECLLGYWYVQNNTNRFEELISHPVVDSFLNQHLNNVQKSQPEGFNVCSA
ncbi:MAG: Mini-ribonuclease 3 [SAR324 cluster bacterium]|nr:Mini-ribonuclease 3 [SAR324 cluster bacterium]